MASRTFLLWWVTLGWSCVAPEVETEAGTTCGPFIQREEQVWSRGSDPLPGVQGPWTTLPPFEREACLPFDVDAVLGRWRLRGFRDGAARLWEVDSREPTRLGPEGFEYDLLLTSIADETRFKFLTTCNGFSHDLDLTSGCISWEGATIGLVGCEGCQHAWEWEVTEALGLSTRIFANDTQLALYDESGRWQLYFERDELDL